MTYVGVVCAMSLAGVGVGGDDTHTYTHRHTHALLIAALAMVGIHNEDVMITHMIGLTIWPCR